VSEINTILIYSPSLREEIVNVLRTTMGILVIGLLLSGMHARSREGGEPIYTYQVLFHQQPNEIQRMYRELMSAFEDALALRNPSGRWPAVAQLEAEGIPPFTVLPGAPEYSWEMRIRSDCINYIGQPADTSYPAFLLFIQENVPHPPGTPMTDFHRRLDDGSVLHFMVMFHTNPDPSTSVLYVPERLGWKQIILAAGAEQ
jgi:hypothetical protein